MSWPEESPRRLLCAVDGSPTGRRAAEGAVLVAARHGADVVFLHVLDDDRLRELAALVGEERDEARTRLRASGERILAEAGELARPRDVPFVTRVEDGDPPRMIDQVARDVGADMILVGKVGQRGVRRWFVGSVTRRLIEISGVPVVVIPGGSPS